MNRIEFMKKLEALLRNISVDERKEAIQYYNDYFDDAGPENEDEVIKDLHFPDDPDSGTVNNDSFESPEIPIFLKQSS